MPNHRYLEMWKDTHTFATFRTQVFSDIIVDSHMFF